MSLAASGLVASRTSGSFLNAATVSSIGFLYLESVSLAPEGARRTTGFVPFACDGNFAARRSVAFWLSLPGSVRLSLRSGPAVRAANPSTTKMTSHTAMTTRRWRTPT